jgi:hypothetical protein
VAVAPAAVIPGGLNRFVFAKNALFALALAFAGVANCRTRLSRPAGWLLLAGLAWVALCGSLTPDPGAVLAGMAPRYEGLPVLALYGAAVWAGARLLGRGGSGKRASSRGP